ncbi:MULTISPECIES: hypothetical protein [unclassified Microbacterium]
MRADQVSGPVRLPELAPSPLLRGWALVALLSGVGAAVLLAVGMVVS